VGRLQSERLGHQHHHERDSSGPEAAPRGYRCAHPVEEIWLKAITIREQFSLAKSRLWLAVWRAYARIVALGQ